MGNSACAMKCPSEITVYQSEKKYALLVLGGSILRGQRTEVFLFNALSRPYITCGFKCCFAGDKLTFATC
jgi:hypothetical protein